MVDVSRMAVETNFKKNPPQARVTGIGGLVTLDRTGQKQTAGKACLRYAGSETSAIERN
jgi:hypothetical protein